MTADRAEWTGVGAALLFHVALIVALSISLASVDDVARTAVDGGRAGRRGRASGRRAHVRSPSPPPPQPAPEIGRCRCRPADRPLPQPIDLRSARDPTLTPRRAARPAPAAAASAARAPRPAAPAPARPRPAARAAPASATISSRASTTTSRQRAAPSRPAAPTFSAQARTSVANSIASQAQRCANRQPYLGDGADQLRVQVRLSFARSGRLARPPGIGSISGDSDLRAKYGELLEDQVRRIFAECAPFRLPADLYDTANGGWKETTLTYRVRK